MSFKQYIISESNHGSDHFPASLSTFYWCMWSRMIPFILSFLLFPFWPKNFSLQLLTIFFETLPIIKLVQCLSLKVLLKIAMRKHSWNLLQCRYLLPPCQHGFVSGYIFWGRQNNDYIVCCPKNQSHLIIYSGTIFLNVQSSYDIFFPVKSTTQLPQSVALGIGTLSELLYEQCFLFTF